MIPPVLHHTFLTGGSLWRAVDASDTNPAFVFKLLDFDWILAAPKRRVLAPRDRPEKRLLTDCRNRLAQIAARKAEIASFRHSPRRSPAQPERFSRNFQ